MRAALYYLLSFLALVIYGVHVCPYIASLTLPDNALRLGAGLGLAWLLRRPLLERFVTPLAAIEQPRRQFRVDFGLFLGAGAVLTLFNTAYSHFPVASGAKVMLGCATFGLFFGLALALEHERRVMERLARAGAPVTSLRGATSLSRRFALFAGAAVTLVAGDLLLVILKDLSWIVEVEAAGLEHARRVVVTEVVFIMGILCALTLHLVFTWARNLRLLFENETAVLEQVAQGELARYVMVATDDEFGLIALHTNRMIDGLRERNRVKQLFGKMVSPEIARRLLEQGEAALKPAGSRRNLVILFSDVRDFTTRTEESEPEAVVEDLNCYFAEMVAIVHDHGGIVDKFLGDGLMAVFGLEGSVGAADQAVRAALAMQETVRALGGRLSRPLEIGIGIHQGEVVAGTIGSPERLEYTFIGDAVNTAARLEGATRRLGAEVLISSSLYHALTDQASAWPWTAFGPQPLKGKNEQIELYGIVRQGTTPVAA